MAVGQKDVESLRQAYRTAVAQVVASRSTGTGFLVEHMHERLLLTSCHVLPDASTAQGAHVVFDQEAHLQPVKVSLCPKRLFCSDASLGFALVACDLTSAGRREPLLLFPAEYYLHAGSQVSRYGTIQRAAQSATPCSLCCMLERKS
jgi:hypothetical protein